MSAPFVQTVRGPIPPDQLGSTLMHEHLTVLGVGLGIRGQAARN
jgi:predicted metal-dependent phosphotriesterase family hydrolase